MERMSTVVSTRAEREAEARRLRSEGLFMREIAERIGVAVSTVDAYLNDPGGVRLRARKDSYRGQCSECGAPTDGSRGPGKAASLCQSCHEWSDDDCVWAIERWVAKHGEPPTCVAWSRSGSDHPTANTVIRRCGGWNAALLRAGLDIRCDRRPETQEWVEDQIRAGTHVADVAAELGVCEAAVYRRINGRGMSTWALRRGAA
jgi:predicted transcriptional regulator